MALQAGVSTSKVLILVGAGLTSSIILKNGRLSELIGQLQEVLKGVDQVEIAPYKYDSALLAAQIRQLAQEIKELTLSSPVTIYNGNSASNDVMFVTKKNMANAVATVSKQMENVSETLAFEMNLGSWFLVVVEVLGAEQHRIEEHNFIPVTPHNRVLHRIGTRNDLHKGSYGSTCNITCMQVDEMKSNLSQIGYDVESIHQMISGLDTTNSGLWHLCQFAGGFKDGFGTKVYQDVGAKLANPSAMAYEERSLKGLQFIAETKESDMVEKPVENVKNDLDTVKTRIHRSYPVGFSLTRDIVGSGI
ncbi:hypothetical protein POTOM_010923 [Populus tomentosa]|uniref:Uncharacterized protein n=1 Tax=Populus tomentosa TaxID=118781 RepID=A0A8X8D2P6_POPTO|nr:hypothetical protein POTOM_010923 [Populus tomentosa]